MAGHRTFRETFKAPFKDAYDLKFIRGILPFLEGLYKYYFRCRVDGLEKIPDGPVLFVGNHNGILAFEVLMLFYAWWKRFGPSRRVLGLAHRIMIESPPFSWVVPRFGVITAEPERAHEALTRGYSVVVYPGGEKESFRPYSQRREVQFFGRKGFVRLALKAKVPIVPIVSVGAHESYIILDRGEWIAKKLGFKDRFRLHGIPVTFRGLFFLLCLASGTLFLAPAALFLVFIPLPTQMTFKVLPAIDVCGMVDPTLSEEENHKKIYDEVAGSIQAVLSEEYAKRRLPFIG